MTYCIVSSKIYYKRDDFIFEIFNFTFLDRDFSRSHFHPYGVYISQLTCFVRVWSCDFNNKKAIFDCLVTLTPIGIIHVVKHFQHSTTDIQS